MRTLSHIQCTAVGCTNQACVQINDDLLCTQCAHADLTNEQIHQAEQAAFDHAVLEDAAYINNVVREPNQGE